MKEAEVNPVVLLSPRTYGNIICNRPIPSEKDMPALIKEYTQPDFLDKHSQQEHNEKVDFAIDRFQKVPYFK
jgi:hypothetical protein